MLGMGSHSFTNGYTLLQASSLAKGLRAWEAERVTLCEHMLFHIILLLSIARRT